MSKSVVGGMVLVVVLLVAVVWLYSGGGGGEKGQRYYIDIATGDRFAAAPALAPVAVPDGGALTGVAAHVYSCGECGDDAFVGFVEKYSTEGKAAEQKLLELGPMQTPERPAIELVLKEGHFMASFDEAKAGEPEWVAFDGDDATAIRRSIGERCGGKAPVRCVP